MPAPTQPAPSTRLSVQLDLSDGDATYGELLAFVQLAVDAGVTPDTPLQTLNDNGSVTGLSAALQPAGSLGVAGRTARPSGRTGNPDTAAPAGDGAEGEPGTPARGPGTPDW